MDFDEYEYLEKSVENPEDGKERIQRSKRTSEGAEHGSKRDRDRDRDRVRDMDRDRARTRARSRSEEDTRTLRDHRDRGRFSHRRFLPEFRSKNFDTLENKRYRSSRERETDHPDRNGSGRYKDREKPKEEGDRDEIKDRERSQHRTDKESKDREFKETEREKEPKGNRNFKERKEEAPEPEADPERDQRTVFAYQICLKANEKDVYEFFSRAGKVRDVQLIMDRNSRRSKGVGYIEFYDAMSVPMAIALSGQLLHSQPVMIKPSEAEKNLVQSSAAVGGGLGGFIGPNSGGARRLYVGNLHFHITEDQLRQVFEPFGTVELVQLPTDPETGECKGFGFVQFTRLEDARAAQSLNCQLEIAGRVIKVSAVSDQAGMQDLGANASDFDDDDGGGMSLNAHSRAILMQKLDRSGTATSVAGSVATQPLSNPALGFPGSAVPIVSPLAPPIVRTLGSAALPGYMGLQSSMLTPPAVVPPAVDLIGVPSNCLLLKNMFDPKNETEPDFDVDIKEDVNDECSKFGTVKHIFVDKYSAGHVYLCFDSVTSAVGAQCALHGRWFAGKMITATYMLSSSYGEKFPDRK